MRLHKDSSTQSEDILYRRQLGLKVARFFIIDNGIGSLVAAAQLEVASSS
jgi:hypothetical protein